MRTHRGFTLVELLVVIVIIAILASLLVVLIKGMVELSRNHATKAEIETLSLACDAYRAEVGCYPPMAPYTGSQNLHFYLGGAREVEIQQGVVVLREPILQFRRDWLDPAASTTQPAPPVFVYDAWGKILQVSSPGVNNAKGVDLWSEGRNSLDAADDLSNWMRDV